MCEFATGKLIASAGHILVSSEMECDEILKELQLANDLQDAFPRLAKERSTCPTGRYGGSLGSFGRGEMVPEFDNVVFDQPVGNVHKVKTQFGWHLVLVTDRSRIRDSMSKDWDEL
ncbi:-type peptidyl-prolyl cis-trans [Plasmopara halstedii]|uniref:Peptidyl-prolyl cis-trans isomerase n=1 Tax=Plasmopara halstedii TaxID=4781 RepID=A0A0P1B705_PLAHL|nr:-type peptidyl-prolyl cis-trans [Plasmopara halstedii]CEG50176.1 -type peptidyl-prolyl cis-trans [Plasmopara halstedii]|eukprot:XP_024586545.1 -type peptidyl-prolyl cis-trans [Plasmopara halstedii]